MDKRVVMLMNRLMAALALVFFISSKACAHKDVILPINEHGVISGIPPALGPGQLEMEFSWFQLPTPVSKLVLHLGGKPLVFPKCLTRLLNTDALSKVEVSGSWFHDEAVLPYYLNIHFQDGTYDPYVSTFIGYSTLINLRTNTLLRMTEYSLQKGHKGDQQRDVDLESQCSPEELANFSYQPES
ncbi:MAG: hypothetical protein AAAB16_12380 [Pseudomonas sp.]|uniref:hypothetical protein n=1 Tax=Pseudomonas sp. TaxID=306 RepID=UPI0030F081B0